MTEIEAAKRLGISPRALRNARANGNGPEFHRYNHKLVRYTQDALDAYLAATKISPAQPTA